MSTNKRVNFHIKILFRCWANDKNDFMGNFLANSTWYMKMVKTKDITKLVITFQFATMSHHKWWDSLLFVIYGAYLTPFSHSALASQIDRRLCLSAELSVPVVRVVFPVCNYYKQNEQLTGSAILMIMLRHRRPTLKLWSSCVFHWLMVGGYLGCFWCW